MSQIFTLTLLIVQLLSYTEILDLEGSQSLLGFSHFGLLFLTNLIINFCFLFELNLPEFRSSLKFLIVEPSDQVSSLFLVMLLILF